MPDPTESANPTGPIRRHPSTEPVLPGHDRDDRADDRTTERVEAYPGGPAAPPQGAATTPERVRRPIELDTRIDWMVALRLEEARHTRYGRPASVVLIELVGLPPGATLDRIARAVAEVIKAEARETDRAVRVGAASFRVLLPETTGRAARAFVERLSRALAASPGDEAAIDLHIEIATASRTDTLEGALADAEARLGIGLGPPAVPPPSAAETRTGLNP